MPMPPPTRIAPGGVRGKLARPEKALPSGPLTQTRSPGSSSQSRSVPGPDRLDQEVEADATVDFAVRLGDREGPGQEGPPARCSQWRSVASM